MAVVWVRVCVRAPHSVLPPHPPTRAPPPLQVLATQSAVLPQQVVAGAARFQALLLLQPRPASSAPGGGSLSALACSTGVLCSGPWGVGPDHDGSYLVSRASSYKPDAASLPGSRRPHRFLALPLTALQLLEGGRALPLPQDLCHAPPTLLCLFLACVWLEANLAEGEGLHRVYTVTAGGGRMTDARDATTVALSPSSTL